MILLYCIFASNAIAEQHETEDNTEISETDQQATDDSENIQIDENKTPSLFIPSEEISEDLSVSFPVDI
jgi:hypothetical protein